MKKTRKILTIVLSIVLCAALLSIGTFVYASENNKKNSIGLDAAIDIAMSDAGCAEENTIIQKARRTFEDGCFVYDIQFIAGGYEYDYLLKASDGTILEKDKEKEDAPANADIPTNSTADVQTSEAAPAEITLEQAKQLALKNAGLSANNVTFTKAYKDYEEDDDDDDVTHYDIEFYDNSYEYEYEISLNGDILSIDKDPRKTSNSGESNKGNSSNNGSTGNSGNAASGNKDNTESSSNTGSSNNTNSSGSQKVPEDTKYIGIDKAKSIALNHAGLSASDVKFTKAKLEKDDGVMEYEIEFYKDAFEYEYDIDAKTGKILSAEKEMDD